MLQGEPKDMTSTSQIENQTRMETGKQAFLRSFPYEKGFHFYTELGKYSGMTATNIDEFARKLQVVPAESVNFHLQRDDFQIWLKNPIGDEELALRIERFKRRSRLSGENLRRELLVIVQRRLAELR